MKDYKISILGTLATYTEFRNHNNDTVRVKVWFKTGATIAYAITTYNYVVSIRPFKHKKFMPVISSSNAVSDAYKEVMTQQDLYTCFFNHWESLNPIKMFNTGQIGDSKSTRYNGFKVKPNNLEPIENTTIKKSFI